MILKKVLLGDLIEKFSQKCGIPDLSVYNVSGISKDKEFFEPSKQVGQDTSDYKIVPPDYFACNLMHIGRDVVLPISLNQTKVNKYVSPAYSIFKLRNTKFCVVSYCTEKCQETNKSRR